MKKKILFFLLLLLMLSAILYLQSKSKTEIPSALKKIELSEIEKLWLANNPVIKIAPDPYFPPVEWFDENGNYKGIAADFIEIIEQQIDVHFEVIRCESWEEVLQKARNKEVDLLPAAAQTLERAEYMLFSEPHLVFPGVIITTKRNEHLDKTQKLYHKKVGIVSGYVWHEYIRAEHPKIRIVGVENVTTGLRKVSIEEIDAFIVTLPIALYYIEQEGIHNLVVAGETEYKTKLSILVRKDWKILHGIVNKALQSIPEERKKEIIQKWISLKSLSMFHQKNFWIIVISLLVSGILIVFVSILWNSSLKRQVKIKTKELQDDIKKRKKIEKALQKSEEEYKFLVENQIDLLVKVDDNGYIQFVSPSYCKTFGKTEEELIGNKFMPLVHPDDVEKTKAAMQKLTQPPHTCYLEQRAKTVNGWEWFAWIDNAILNETGNVKEIIGVGRNITEQKQMETELRDLKNKLETEVAMKTKELKQRIKDLERFHDATVQRELRMKELRDEIDRLKKQAKGKVDEE